MFYFGRKKIMSDILKIRQEGGFFRLSPSLLIRMTGNDRLRYLNGQVTADLHKLIPGEAMQACLLTSKGKLLAILSITAIEDALLIEVDRELSELVQERLKKYIIADDVTLDVEDAPEKLHFFGNILDHPILQKIKGININRLGIKGKDVELFQLESLMGLSSQEPLAPEMVDAFRIAQGVPLWGRELEIDMLPQEAGLEKTFIDDEKGCYVGQETVSRLRSIGHVNRTLCGFIGEGDMPLMQGMKLFSNDKPSLPIGSLTSVAVHTKANEKKFIALGYLRRGYEKIGTQVTAIDPETEVAVGITVTVFPIL